MLSEHKSTYGVKHQAHTADIVVLVLMMDHRADLAVSA